MADTKPLHQTRFEAAVSVIQSLPKNGSFQPSNEMMLKFYSFYKQATQGPCNVPKPAFWDPVGRYKWDAWSSLGDMSKEDAMVAYVDEMKKILETMPMTEKVEELLQVIGPFYEIVEDKKHGRGSGVSSVRLDKVTKSLEDLSNVLTSTPNCKAVNGKAESSDSGAESEEEGAARNEEVEEEDEEDDNEDSDQEEKCVENDSAVQSSSEITIANGPLLNHSSYVPEVVNPIATKSALDDTNKEVEICEEKPSTEGAENALERERDEDWPDDIAAIHHLTSDSDSEIFCDSMEQFGQEEVDHSQLLHEAMSNEDTTETSTGGEVKDGGEDGKPSGRIPQKEKTAGEKSEYPGSRRGRVSRMHPVGEGSRGGQMGSGGDGERWGSEKVPGGSLSEQITVVLMRMQDDMQNVLQRLQSLETLTASQARSLVLNSNYKQSAKRSPAWWPFDISPGTLTFAVVWPFVAHWLVHVYLQRKRR
ncbi:acyl-CoA-binding domain-containing protein 5 isoform 2-T2 [Pelodytes ibericus]